MYSKKDKHSIGVWLDWTSALCSQIPRRFRYVKTYPQLKDSIQKIIVSSTPIKKHYRTSIASGKNEIDMTRAVEQTERLRLWPDQSTVDI